MSNISFELFNDDRSLHITENGEAAMKSVILWFAEHYEYRKNNETGNKG